MNAADSRASAVTQWKELRHGPSFASASSAARGRPSSPRTVAAATPPSSPSPATASTLPTRARRTVSVASPFGAATLSAVSSKPHIAESGKQSPAPAAGIASQPSCACTSATATGWHFTYTRRR